MANAALKLFLPLLLLGTLLVGAVAADESRPNIVVILVDDMGYSDLGCYGGEIDTPQLDALAKNGVRFTQFYNTAKCSQTRATLLTGQYYPEVGLMKLANSITIAEGLKQAGYRTFMVGKWHLRGNPVERGFDRYFGHLSGATNFFTGDKTFRLDDKPFDVPESGFYTTDANTDYAIEFLDKSRGSDKPFFLYMAFNAPHYPLQCREEDYRKYEGKYAKGWDVLRRERYARQLEMGLIDRRWKLSPRPDDVPAWDSLSAKKKEEHGITMAAYAAMIDRVDQNVGRLRKKLEAMGDFENTLILFLSDNGGCPFQRTRKRTREERLPPWDPKSYWTYDKGWAHACNTPFRLYKRQQHEGGISTPLIAHWPAGIQQPGRLDDSVGHLVDILPTCFELAGAEYPNEFDGHTVGRARGMSFVPLLKAQPRTAERELFFLFGRRTNMALRQGDWKLVAHDRGEWELYNMRKDRTELNDLAEEQPQRLKRMIDRYEELHEEVSD